MEVANGILDLDEKGVLDGCQERYIKAEMHMQSRRIVY
jgi:hypothetical protein